MSNPDAPNTLTRATSFTASMARFATGRFRTISHQAYQDRFAGQRTILKGSFSTDSGFSTTTNDFQNEYTRDGKGRLTGIKQTKQGTGGSYSVVADKNFILGYNGQDQLIDLDRYASTGTSNLVAHTDYDRDYMGRLTKLDHLKGGTHFATYDLARDARSRITAIDSVFSNSAWNEDHNFTYDHTDQLIAADHSVQNDEAYNLTANGNRTGNQTHLGATNSSTVTADNHISTDGVFNYTQDNEGNVITKTNISTGDKQEFAYDHRNRLIKVTFKNNSNVIQKTVEYVYDHDDLMIKRTETPYTAGAPGTAQSDFYVRESAQILLAFHKNGGSDAELTNRYVWTDQIDMVLSDEQVTSLGSAGTVYYVLGDHQNSVVDLVTYNSGTDTTTVAKHRKFNAFGNTTLDSAPGISSIYGYTSMYFDVITSLQYNWHRWYDPFTGRWMGPDPMGLAPDENPFRYVGNHPSYGTDPTGLEEQSDGYWPLGPTSWPLEGMIGCYVWLYGMDIRAYTLLHRWNYGDGTPLNIDIDTDSTGIWRTAMRENRQLQAVLKDHLTRVAQRVAQREAPDTAPGHTSISVPFTFLSDTYGPSDLYGYLHGANPNFTISIGYTIDHKHRGDYVVTMDVTYIWKDKIDPKNGAFDYLFTAPAQCAGSKGNDYDLTITWRDRSTIVLSNSFSVISKTGWPFTGSPRRTPRLHY